MKLSKASWIILAIGVLVIAAGSLGWVYSQRLHEQKQLDQQLSAANKNLSQTNLEDLKLQKDQLNEQIIQLNDLLATRQTFLQESQDSIDVTNTILEHAQSHRIDILKITSPGLSGEQLSGTSFDSLSIDLNVAGSLQDISGFAISLNEIFPTSIESLVQFNRQEPTPTPTPTDSPTPTPTPEELVEPVPPGFTPIVPPEKNYLGTINLLIYYYRGN